ncbi:phage tail protein [Halobacillus seohaensis]|uniref:Phage tail tape measure protein n=1 Tax=Halobacillus seohaensis TaxID=447421 RepID=A0ABW2ENM0_9BACI
MFRSSISGSILTMVPPAVTALGVLAGGLGAMLPVLGTVAGGTLGLASSLGAAASGAGLLAPFLFTLGSDLADMDKSIERNTDEWYSLSDSTRGALSALDKLRETFGKLKDSVSDPIYEGMASMFQAAEQAVKLASPAVKGMAEAFKDVGASLRENMGSADVKAIFSWLETAAPRAFTAISETLGHFLVGIGNLMRAFDPLASEIESGLLRMAESFREWTASLSGSQKFEDFLNFVRDQGPKLLNILGNIVGGLVGMGVAFAPLSKDMISGFEDMTQKFEEWGGALSESQGFKDFVSFVRENTPGVLELIGNLTRFGLELAKGFAEIGSVMLPIINNFLQWTTALMQNNPWISKLIALLPVLVGVLKIGAGIVLVLTNAFRFLWPVISKVFSWIGKLGGVFVRLAPVITRAGIFLLRFAGPIGVILSLVGMLASYIMINWDKIAAYTQKIWNKMPEWVTGPLGKIGGFVKEQWQEMTGQIGIEGEKQKEKVSTDFGAMSTDVSTNMGQMESYISSGLTNMQGLFSSNLPGMKSNVDQNFGGMDSAVGDNVRRMEATTGKSLSSMSGIVSTDTGLMSSDVLSNFEGMSGDVSSFMGDMDSNVTSQWGNAESTTATKTSAMQRKTTAEFRAQLMAVTNSMNRLNSTVQRLWNTTQAFLNAINLHSIGTNIMAGLLNGISGMAGALFSKARSIASGISGTIRGALNIHSPSRVMADIGGNIGTGLLVGLERMKSPVERAATKLAETVSKPLDKMATDRNFSVSTHANSYGEGLGKQIAASRSGSGSSNTDTDRIAEAVASGYQLFADRYQNGHETVIKMDRHIVGRLVEPEVSTIQKREQDRDKRFS